MAGEQAMAVGSAMGGVAHGYEWVGVPSAVTAPMTAIPADPRRAIPLLMTAIPVDPRRPIPGRVT